MASLASTAGADVPAASPEALEFFESKVRPVLVERCHACHGPDEQESGLRLDHITAILRGGKRGAAVAAGHADQSLLLEAVGYEDSALKMPPDGKLPAEEIAALRQWIEAGAAWPDEPPPEGIAGGETGGPTVKHNQWWRRPIALPEVPRVQDVSWPRTDVDRFILARLEAAGLRPAEAADKRTLIRRAYFDLIGLPPAPAEVEEFLADSAPGAFERVVERLLASPHYGERWGRQWLDVVRYTDDIRTGASIMTENYRYRDWVVDAFNRDLPYDQFMMRQVAGDLMPAGSAGDDAEGIIATGLLALGEWSALDADKQKMALPGFSWVALKIAGFGRPSRLLGRQVAGEEP
jgi:hypothetical protein